MTRVGGMLGHPATGYSYKGHCHAPLPCNRNANRLSAYPLAQVFRGGIRRGILNGSLDNSLNGKVDISADNR